MNENMKIVILGATESGKSTLVEAAFNGKFWVKGQAGTPSGGAEHLGKTLDVPSESGESTKKQVLEVWTLPGGEFHDPNIPLYINNTSLFVLTVDDQNIDKSIEYLRDRMMLLAPLATDKTQFVITFTKSDHEGFADNGAKRDVAKTAIKAFLSEHLQGRYEETNVTSVEVTSKTEEGAKPFREKMMALSKLAPKVIGPSQEITVTRFIKRSLFWKNNKGTVAGFSIAGTLLTAGAITAVLGGPVGVIIGIGLMVAGGVTGLVTGVGKLFLWAKAKLFGENKGAVSAQYKAVVMKSNVNPALAGLSKPSVPRHSEPVSQFGNALNGVSRTQGQPVKGDKFGNSSEETLDTSSEYSDNGENQEGRDENGPAEPVQ